MMIQEVVELAGAWSPCFSSTISMGDFNVKHSSWGCDVDSQRGVRLKNYIERTGYRILAPPTPTRYGHNSASTLDFAITQNAILANFTILANFIFLIF
ncbi:hypothetical protein TNCV_4188321 [Trichonephila clavipes]|nr:hypothetical protein TNCV_4188321 [Trichonephila clavipes]